jgi:hypothetical protein
MISCFSPVLLCMKSMSSPDRQATKNEDTPATTLPR